jgi:LacI family transcriptional regulator
MAANKISSLAPDDTRIRIKDIAVLANVSPGTVDRVIHNRGGVALESKERIEKILAEMHFKPNKMAQLLANKKDCKLTALLPEVQAGDYWSDLLKGMVRAEEEVADYHVRTELMQFNQYSRESFAGMSQQLLDLNPDGVLLAPFFRREVLKLTKELEDRNIPFVFVDSYVDGVNNLAYYGQQSYQSGYVAAKIMLVNLPKHSSLLLVHMLREGNNVGGSNQTARREEGFLSYLEKYSLESDYNIVRVNLHHNDDEGNEAQLLNAFTGDENIRGIIMFNSRIYHIGNFLEKHKLKNIRAVGYDLLDRNVRYLKSGLVECLIAQRPQLQGYYGIMALVKHLVMGQTPQPVCYMPIDILFRENINDYKVYPFDVE